tara:strand:+ start:754 stop:1011 length:258 start_codon:yes stop_codon:yes gene_type:complete
MSDNKKKIDAIRKESHSNDLDRIASALSQAIDLLEKIEDERGSAWLMLDEMKAADMKNHLDLQKTTIDNAINRVKLLMATKVGKA